MVESSRRWRLEISYCGSSFCGFQIQKGKLTVQGEIERILTTLCNQRIVVNGSGRTDTGVHALRQIVSFFTPSSFSLSQERILRALRGLIHHDIGIISLQEVAENFHARFNTVGKTYIYIVYLGELNNPFTYSFCWQYSYPLKKDMLLQVCQTLEGEHDFFNFCIDGKKYGNNTTIRHLHRCRVEMKGDYAFFSFCGTGFLYRMARILVSHTLDRAGNRGVSKTEQLFDRNYRGIVTKEVAVAKGLFLANVFYNLDDYSNHLEVSALDYLAQFGLNF